jgi:hypothetical protein
MPTAIIHITETDATASSISGRQFARNKLLGMWAAEKLGIRGGDAEAYSDALAMDALDHEHSDVFSKIRRNFDAAGVTQSDEQILSIMKELMIQARHQMDTTRAGSAEPAVMLARKLKSP